MPPLILLVCWAVAGAYIIPRLMPGTVVIIKYAPIGSLAYLQISPSNLRHSIYLALNCFTCCCLASDIASYPAAFRRLLVKTFEVSAWGAMVIILWHMLHFYTGFPFPSSFFLSNPGAMLNETGALRPDLRQRSVFVRPSGTFSEPSFAALFVVGLFAFVPGLLPLRQTRGVAPGGRHFHGFCYCGAHFHLRFRRRKCDCAWLCSTRPGFCKRRHGADTSAGKGLE